MTYDGSKSSTFTLTTDERDSAYAEGNANGKGASDEIGFSSGEKVKLNFIYADQVTKFADLTAAGVLSLSKGEAADSILQQLSDKGIIKGLYLTLYIGKLEFDGSYI